MDFDAGLSSRLSPHSFRATTITDLLEQGVPLEYVQHLAGHADPRTTRLYDGGKSKSRETSWKGFLIWNLGPERRAKDRTVVYLPLLPAVIPLV